MVKKYDVGLDIGTGSVGFVAMDGHYRLVRAKGKNLIGVRLFDAAQTAEERRGYRTTRRRLSRRRWRIRLLNSLFAPEFQASQDPNFLHRLKYSWVNPKDDANVQNYSAAPLFNDAILEQNFHANYPTIYHLRKTLMGDDQQHDLREVYLAMHHILKYRGNFLRGEGPIQQDHAFDVHGFVEACRDFYEALLPDETIIDEVNEEQLLAALVDPKLNRTEKGEQALLAFNNGKDKKAKTFVKAILGGILGNQTNLITIFQHEGVEKSDQKEWKFKFTDGSIEEEIEAILNQPSITDIEKEFLNELQMAFDGLTLKLLLKDASSLSAAMIDRYESHRVDWAWVKENLRTSANKKAVNDAYLDLQTDNEDKRTKALKYFEKLIDDNETISAEVKQRLTLKINNNEFLPIQRSKANISIPHQLHLNELHAIIEKQKQYYPFLAATDDRGRNKIEQLLKFRVPYYVGPLVEAEKVAGDSSNHWMKRKADGVITPWNFTEKIDQDQAGIDFIKRMTGTDSYLIGEPTLPKNSMYYQEFTVLQELNNIRIDKRRLRVDLKQEIFEQVFKTNSSVSAKMIEAYIKESQGIEVRVSGLSDTKTHKFNNRLTTYHYFLTVFDREYLENPANRQTLEEIVELQTVFEDRKVLKRQLEKISELTDEQVTKLAKHHVTGWGQFSKKLLTTKVIRLSKNADTAKLSILEVLYQTNMNFMELMSDGQDIYGLRAWVEAENGMDTKNSSLKQTVAELAGPKEIKRGILQSFYILDELTKVLGNPPQRVYLEFARDTQESKLTNSRLNRLKELYKNKALAKEFQEITKRLGTETKETIQDDRLYLYYLQQGRDMYTGHSIDIGRLSSDYQIDHIIPQAYTKNNSLDNRVLVRSESNARKSDSPTYLPELIDRRISWWQQMKKLGLMSEKKFNNLTRRKDFSEVQKERFIARSLVETRQIIRNVATLIEDHFNGETRAQAIRSEITADMRRYINVRKNRDINDYHHGYDALFITAAGEFMGNSGILAKGQLSDYANNVYNRYTKDILDKARQDAEEKHKSRVRPFGFIVGSMASEKTKNQTNKETGEIVWSTEDAAYLRKVTDYKKIMVTKKVRDQKGPLYDESRYSVKSKKGKIAFDKHKDIDLYGGFSSAKPAYSALVHSKKKFRLVNVQRLWLSEMKRNPEYLLKMVRAQLKDQSAQIVLAHIPYGQEVIKDGALLTISSATELHNFRQLYLPADEYRDLTILLKAKDELKAQAMLNRESHGKEVNARFDELLADVIQRAKKWYPLSTHQNSFERLTEKVDLFSALNFEDKQMIFQRILNALHANPSYSDLKKLKLSGSWSRLVFASGVILDSTDKFVYTSYTGIFSKKISVQELFDQSQKE